MKHSTRSRSVAVGGFTLIEVLIAVLVLSLGMLGLAAVFPVVIAQQRDAVDRTRGAVIGQTVEGVLKNADGLVAFDGLRRDFWFSAANALDCATGYDLSPQNMSFLWEPTWRWGPNTHMGPMMGGQSYQATGTIMVGMGRVLSLTCSATTPSAQDQYEIPATSRLFPQPYTGEQPQYVWDIIPRRSRLGGDRTALELAVFVRRIDPGIRVPAGRTLSDVLTGNRVSAQERRLAVGMDPTTRLPTGDGRGSYSMPMTLPVLVRSSDPSRVVLGGGTAQWQQDLWAATIARPGQILIDNLGNVLNVVGVPERGQSGELAVIVDRAYSASETDYVAGTDPRGVKVEQILFTTQKPIRAFTIRPEW